LLPDLSRVDDEFERVGILVLLHQLEVDEPFGICYRGARNGSRTTRRTRWCTPI
jgi:hypothetical protein